MPPSRRHSAFCILVLGLLAGCAGTNNQNRGPAAMSADRPAIELLGFPGCPNTPEMRTNLKAALASLGESGGGGASWTFTDTDQEALAEGDIRRGWPTPTILVNGRDLFGMVPPTAASMGCRMYPGGVPESEEIADRLKAEASR